jgi:anaerobic dimethyl sulfoxide reductase subunit A
MADIELSDRTIDRRSFVVAGAAVATTLATAGMLHGCGDKAEQASDGSGTFAPEGTFEGGKTATSLNDGEWKSMACYHGCGMGCVNKALVKDGIVVRTKTDDTHEDSLEHPQFRGCLRGRCLAELEFGADRLKYPMKRKSWSPEDSHGELRGTDDWERISWDEALDIVADQIRKVYTTYGPRSVLKAWDLFFERSAVLDACGGFLTTWDTVSFGSYASNLWQLGLPFTGQGTVNDRFDLIENADLIVLYGQNPAWSSTGLGAWYMWSAKQRGAEFICVGPANNASANLLGAKWIRVLPGTDTAFLLGVVYEMLRLDEEQGDIIDWDFLHSYCVGFDDESMPADAKLNENLMGYVRGDYDGIPKTPEWASAICGTPTEDITYFARTVNKETNAVLSHGFAAGRCSGSEDLPQLYLTVACLGGHIGKPGNACGLYYVDGGGCGGAPLVKAGDAGDAWDVSSCKPLCAPEDISVYSAFTGGDYINGHEMYDAILDGRYRDVGIWVAGNWKPLEEKSCDIHFIEGTNDSSLRSAPGNVKGIEAYKTVDFIVMRDYMPKANCYYADVILPISGRLEKDDVLTTGQGDREGRMYFSKVLDPSDEVRSTRWVDEQLLERLGYDPSKVFPVSPEQALYNKIAGSQVMNEQGEYKNLVTLTQEDIDAMGTQGTPQEGVITLAEFKEKGIYSVERHAGDAFTHIGYADFIKDPEKNPLPSASGKFEIYCQAKADTFNNISFNGEGFKPYPTYHEVTPVEGYEFRCYNPHYPRTATTDFGNVATLREAWIAPIFLNSNDAATKGVTDGDDVLISSPFGKVLRKACVTALVIEGAVGLPNGTWPKFDEDGIDRGGCGSTLIGGKPAGMGITGHNNAWVTFEKWTGSKLNPDYEWQLSIKATV